MAFFTRVRSCYLALAAADAKRYRVLDGTQSLEQVRAAAERAVLELAATQRGLPT